MTGTHALQPAGVGEVRLVRTFRVGADGGLYPVNTAVAWQDGWNTAVCNRGRAHDPPADGCRCGFYAYADPVYAAEQPPARDVLAVIAADGTLEVGTRGARVGHARIAAVWFSRRVPAPLAALVRQRYPDVALYRQQAAMLAAHPLTGLAEFRQPRLSPAARRWARGARLLFVAAALVVGALPVGWITATPAAAGGYLALLLTVAGTAAAGVACRSPMSTLLGVWLLGWLLSERSPLSVTLLVLLALWVALVWRHAQRIGAVLREPRYAGTLRRWRGRWMSQ